MKKEHLMAEGHIQLKVFWVFLCEKQTKIQNTASSLASNVLCETSFFLKSSMEFLSEMQPSIVLHQLYFWKLIIYHTFNLVITCNQVKARKMHFLKMNIIFNSRTTERPKVQCSFLFLRLQCHFLGNYSSFLLFLNSFNTWKCYRIMVFYHYFSMSTWKCCFL